MIKNSKYSFLIEIETCDSLLTKEIIAIKDFLNGLSKHKSETEFRKIDIYDTKVKYLGERY